MPERAAALDLEKTLRMMDVADELRRRRTLVAEHLESIDREKIREQLLARYLAMGHAADPALLDEAIDTVLAQQNRFRPAAPGPARWLAGLWVDRVRLARRFGLPLALVLVLAAGGWIALRGARAVAEAARTRRTTAVATLAARAETLAADVRRLALEPRATELAAAELARAERARRDGDRQAAQAANAELTHLIERLEQEYTLEILRGRERDGSRLYLIVRAVGPDGRPVPVPIRNEETGKTETVSEWGERVDRATYDRVARDYTADRVIDDNVFGRKQRGHLDPDTRWPSSGRITRW